LRLFEAAGASVDNDSGIVKVPERIVSESIDRAGKTFTLYGRDRSNQARYGVGERNYNSVGGEALWVDDTCKERRYASLEDVATATRLADALPHINLVGSMADPHEIPVSYRCVAVAAAQLKNTTKPIHFWFHDRASARFVLEAMAAVRSSEDEAARLPLAYPFLEPISPLKFPFEGLDLLFETSRLSLPVPIGPMAQVGATGPGSLAGTLAQENAEILAGVVITQLINPGNAVCYGGIPHAFDMRTTQLIFAGPEQALMAVAMTQMGKHYGLPVYINVGLTDSKVPDAQAGMEAGMTLLSGALAGADIFGHLGICGVDQGTSLSMLVMQHEIVAYIERLLRGFEVTDETLGLDVIRSVGQDGSFLGEMHTVEHFLEELWFPSLLDREVLVELDRPGRLGHARAVYCGEGQDPERARAGAARRRCGKGARQDRGVSEEIPWVDILRGADARRERMRILLTGAAGCLGRAVRRVGAKKHEFVCVDIAPGDDAEVQEGTFTDVALMRDLMSGCDALIHTAACHGGHREIHTPRQFTEVNVLGLQGLLELADELNVRRVAFSSTMEVVIGRLWDSSGMAVVDETTPPNPDWVYPLNKWQCELLGQYYQRHHGISFTALRYMWFGDEPALTPHLLCRFIVPDDVARANLLAVDRDDLAFNVLHIGPETPLTNADIVQSASDPAPVVDRYWPGASEVLRAADVELTHNFFWPVTRIERARTVLGWQPEVSFSDYLESIGWQPTQA
jgi:trimethylamine--corrinoid protein Co-methyltransferase